MPTTLKQKNDTIKINQFITDKKGHKVAVIIEIEELERLKEIIEDLSDIKAVKGKKNEFKEAFKIPGIKTKAFRVVKPIQGKGIPASELLIKDRR
ncbi:MAG: hypothetical protein AYP45_14955 [Candidatus Brocadia carolinensis]|uniref:Uncharacterized protein n=1 Tax=Candidatus Brocadia carolinensis TaxID=1004156 RepID=A0A1V4AQH7_9BACT|nr:MAG: hypothetical protein AYP45_14955 [Candidatus Brocadia caroliniensis]